MKMNKKIKITTKKTERTNRANDYKTYCVRLSKEKDKKLIKYIANHGGITYVLRRTIEPKIKDLEIEEAAKPQNDYAAEQLESSYERIKKRIMDKFTI